MDWTHASLALGVFQFVIALRLANLATGRDTSGYVFQFNNVYSSHCGSEFRHLSMATSTQEDADGLTSSEIRHTVLLDAQVPTIAISMHRLYHIIVARSRISESRKAHLTLEKRQEQERDEHCERIVGILAHGVPAARLASAMDNNPVLSPGCKRIFREWIDVAALRQGNDACRPKAMRLGERNEALNGGE